MHPVLVLTLLLPGLLLAEEDKQATTVTLLPLQQLWIQPEYSAPALVIALNRSRLSAEINARILSIDVRVGQQVNKGERLVTLDCRDHESGLVRQRAELDRLETQLAQARNRLQRARNLKSERNISDELLEDRETELNTLLAQTKAQQEVLAQQRRNVERCQINAPFAGQVEARLAADGELAAPGTPLIQLLQLDQAEIEAAVRPESIAAIQQSETRFSYLGASYPVKPVRLSGSVDSRTGARTLRFAFLDQQAPAGAAGRLHWRDDRKQIPADYTQKRKGKLGLFILEAGQARFHPLDGALEGRPALVDLPADTLVIDQGRHGLQDGDPVRNQGD